MADEKDDKSKSGGNGDAKDKAGKNTDAKTGKDSQKQDEKTDNKSGGGDQKTDKTFSQDELDAIVERRLKRERAKDKENADLSENEKLKKELDETKAEMQMSRAKDSFIDKLDIKPGDAAKLFRYYRDDMEFSDAGKITNFEDIVKMAKDDFPNMFPANVGGKGDGGSGNGGGKGGDAGALGDMNSMIRKRSGR